MRVLAVDTATPWEALAILEDDHICAEIAVKAETTHSVRLLPALAQMLKECGLSPEDIDVYAAGIGPGSFTGLRIGLALIKGMSMACAQPAIGISTLDAMAQSLSYTSLTVCPLINARRNEVFAAVYRPNTHGILARSTPFLVIAPEGLHSILGDEIVVFMGDGVPPNRERLRQSLGERAVFAPPETWHPRASVIGRMALEALKASQSKKMPPLVPIYVRLSDAEIHWKER
ncbi:MAG: tRNA (adenosine(37)-N6)-threonylcarbamoyltransferase complex dimerization subunit type 1 TsaB [Deltaproteobacteria bacterium]|nr:tRNA (adenosine(37)-N6)-threonylcarbamoyltransferase complex dimerization subunit type 1 TsaB [Deltaproteobacteria bacterium]